MTVEYLPSEEYESKYEELDLVGEGGYGKVFKVKPKNGEGVFASKHIKTIKKKEKKNAKAEIELLKTISSPFIITFIEAFEDEKHIIMITEYLEGGELFERVVEEDYQLVESDCCHFIKQICKGMEYLHSQHIVHLDIKVSVFIVSTFSRPLPAGKWSS